MSLQHSFVRVLDLVDRDPTVGPFIEENLKSIKSDLEEFILNPNQEITKFNIFSNKKKKEAFDYKACEAYALLSEKFGTNLRHQELVMIASKVAKTLNIKVDRDAKRRKDLLFKWFQDHLNEIQPLLKTMIVFDKNGSIIKTRENVVFGDDDFHNENA